METLNSGGRTRCMRLAVSLGDYLMGSLIDLIESLRYLIKKYGRRAEANKADRPGK